MKPQHALFVENYCRTRNLTRAAIAAGYSEKGAGVQGSRLLKNASIAAAVAAHDAANQKKAAKSLELTSERVMQELANIALFDPATMYDPETGAMLPVAKMPESTRRAIAGIEESIGSRGDKNSKYRISSKLGSLELIAKIFQLVKQQDTFVPVQIVIGDAPPRAERPDTSTLRPVWE